MAELVAYWQAPATQNKAGVGIKGRTGQGESLKLVRVGKLVALMVLSWCYHGAINGSILIMRVAFA